MKFQELSFPAFGPFTDFALKFAPGCGLTVIYGPNESGKSSALRAVRSLLYGISSDNRDEFLHPGDSLRLRALLEHSQGQKLSVTRRKGRGKKTLLDDEGRAFESDVLAPFLEGADEEMFDRLYGLDHRTLSLGGKALLEEGGKVGESLFAAGLGPGFRQVREQLREEADKLWKERSRTLGIDKAIESFRAAQKRAAELSVSAESWHKISEALREEDEKLSSLEAKIRQLDTARQRLNRHRDAHTPLVQREHLVVELLGLEGLPELSSDFPERRQHLFSTLTALRHSQERGVSARDALKQRLAALPAEERLLPHAARIDRLNRALDAVAVAQAHQAPAKARVDATARAMLVTAADLGLEGTEQKLPEASERQRARRLAEAFRRLVDERTGYQAQKNSFTEQLAMMAERRQTLGVERDTRELEASLRRLRMSLGEDNEVSSLEKLLSAKSDALEAALRTLPLWTGDLAELAALSVPGAHHVSDFERNEADLEDRLRADRSELQQIEDRGKQAKAQLEILRGRHKVTTREDLQEARGQRAQVWDEAVKSGWRPEQQSRVERELGRVDDLTDRMLDDAARVTEAERLAREYKECREGWPEQSKKVKERAAELEKLRQNWRELWNSPRLSLRRPAEMLGWLPRREAVLAIEAEVRTLRARLREAIERRAENLRSQALSWGELLGEAALGQSVAQAIERAEGALAPLSRVAEELRQLGQQEEGLKAQLAETRAGLSNTESALEAWRLEWTEVAAAFHRDAEADPRDLEGLLERYEELRKLTEDHERATRDLQEHQLAIESFRQGVSELAEALGETVRPDDLTALIERLIAGLAEERRVHLLRQQLSEELERTERDCDETARSLGQREKEWQALLAEAGGVAESGLSELERKVARRRQIAERLKDLEETLRPLAAGQSMEEFSQSLRDTDWDAVPSQIREFERQIEALEHERANSWHRKGQLEQELRGFDGAEAAAVAAQEAAETMAEGKMLVARYAKFALAEAVLNREMERYRRENEGPVLREASAWFARLTRSAYSGLTTGLDPRTDAPRLEAVSAGGRQVPVEGLSDGTRDQLFMALRLATISGSQESAEPMPLVLDDVLVHFDTERAKATLEVLAEFSKRTQVLLFTHLDRDRALAESLSAHPVSVLTLDSLGL